ncbi:thioredoxin-like domain-containing protein [Cladorrhinum sp. PSN332]|nr:thioredoxin-like domain-containing protein [Cladorrhinum sp. PSN332]
MARYGGKIKFLDLLLLLGGLAILPVVKAWEQHVLSESELSRIVKLAVEQPVLVAFVKPDEPASAALEAEWLSAVSSAAPDQTLLSFDCSASPTTCALQKDMPSYPSIWLLEADKPVIQYKGAKRADAFLRFLERKSRPAVVELKHDQEEELKKFKAGDEVVFVALLSEDDNREAREKFEDVARRFWGEFSFGVIVLDGSGEVAERNKVVAYKMVDGDVVERKGGIGGGVDEFEGWVEEVSRGVIEELTVLNRERLVRRGWPMVYLFGSTEAERQKLRKTLYKFARDYYDTLTTVVVNPYDFPDLMSSLGLDPTVFPAGAVHQLSEDRIYPYPKGQPLTPGAIQNWGMDIYNGRIKPWTRPGAAPASNEDVKPTTRKAATRKINMVNNIPGVKIKIAGRDEL